MDSTILTTITSLAGSIGFPIVCCWMLFWQLNKTMTYFSARMEAAITVLNATLETNTAAVTTLVTTINVIMKVNSQHD